MDDGRLIVPVREDTRLMDVVRALDNAGVEATDVQRRDATLDDVFLTLTNKTTDDDRIGGGGMTALAHDSFALARRNLEHVRQIPEKLLDVTLQPIMFVLLFAYVFGGVIAVPGGDYHEYLVGGILVQTLAFGMMGPGVAIATDMQEGIVDRFRSLPMSRAAFVVGHVIAEMAAIVRGHHDPDHHRPDRGLGHPHRPGPRGRRLRAAVAPGLRDDLAGRWPSA